MRFEVWTLGPTRCDYRDPASRGVWAVVSGRGRWEPCPAPVVVKALLLDWGYFRMLCETHYATELRDNPPHQFRRLHAIDLPLVPDEAIDSMPT